MTKKSGTCLAHGDSFSRLHGRIDKIEIDMTKVNITLFGDPSKNVEGILQQFARFQDKMNFWVKILAFIGTPLSLAIIGMAIKTFIGK